MPVAASRKQYRMMMAIMHGKVKDGPRGRPPRSIAAKYTDPGEDAPESKDNDRGGSWTAEHHKRHAERQNSKEHHKKLKKSFEEFYKGRSKFAATIVLDSNNRVMMGRHRSGGIACPGGHVDPGESFENAALRELHEEAGVVGRILSNLWSGESEGNDGIVYLVEIASGKPKDTDEVKNWKWYEPDQIPWSDMRTCCIAPLKGFIENKLGKSIRGMLAMESLAKSELLHKKSTVELPTKESLRLVGNGMFRHMCNVVDGMGPESFKEFDFDTHKISIRKHVDDSYSGRVSDGNKTIYQFTNKSLPEVTAALMSLFEWYLPDDEEALSLLDDVDLKDDVVHGGLQNLIDNYKRHNLGEIYQEMETIREHIRNGVAVDLQQTENKILKLFDKLEETTREIADKHNKLARKVGDDMDELEAKLRELQSKIRDEPTKKQNIVEAISSNPANGSKVHDRLYSYLTKPRVHIQPTGKITICFGDDWDDMEQSSFLDDMRVKVLARK